MIWLIIPGVVMWLVFGWFGGMVAKNCVYRVNPWWSFLGGPVGLFFAIIDYPSGRRVVGEKLFNWLHLKKWDTDFTERIFPNWRR